MADDGRVDMFFEKNMQYASTILRWFDCFLCNFGEIPLYQKLF